MKIKRHDSKKTLICIKFTSWGDVIEYNNGLYLVRGATQSMSSSSEDIKYKVTNIETGIDDLFDNNAMVVINKGEFVPEED